MNHAEQLQQAASLYLDPNTRDVAEIRFDDLLNPTAEDAIVEIGIETGWAEGTVRVLQESGTITRVWIGGAVDHIPGGKL